MSLLVERVLLEGELNDVSIVVGCAAGLLDVLRDHDHTFKPAGDVPAISCNREQFLAQRERDT